MLFEGKKLRTSNAERRTSNVEVKTRRFSFFTSMFDVRRSMFGVRILFCLALLTTGCASITGHPLTPSLAGDDPDSQIAYWHTLPDRNVISNDEAFHGLLLFVDSEDSSSSYEQRVAKLKSRKMLPADFHAPAAAAADRGTLAVILVRVLSIHGGVTMHLFGDQPRYAVRELVYAGLYPPSSPQQVFSGAQFLGIIGRAEDYQRDSISGTAVMNADEAGNGLLKVAPTTQVTK
jgi:hypothetical protein